MAGGLLEHGRHIPSSNRYLHRDGRSGSLKFIARWLMFGLGRLALQPVAALARFIPPQIQSSPQPPLELSSSCGAATTPAHQLAAVTSSNGHSLRLLIVLHRLSSVFIRLVPIHRSI